MAKLTFGWILGTYVFAKAPLVLVSFVEPQRGSFMVWEVNMGVEFDNIMFINCLAYDIYIYGAF